MMGDDSQSSHNHGEGALPSDAARLRALLLTERRRFAVERAAWRSRCAGLRQRFARDTAYYSADRFRLVDKVHRRLKRFPRLFAVICFLLSAALQAANLARWLLIATVQTTLARLRHARNVVRALGRGLLELAFLDSTMSWVRRTHGWTGVWDYASLRLREVLHGPAMSDLGRWLERARPRPRLLRRFARRRWPDHAPRFTVVLRIHSSVGKLLNRTLQSLARQVYTRWDVMVVATAHVPIPLRLMAETQTELPGEVRFLSRRTFIEALAEIAETAAGDCICVVDQGDTLEPHALYRYADAVLREQADLLYCDLLHTDADTAEPLAVEARPAFSYDYLLTHAYLALGYAVRRAVLRKALLAQPLPSDDFDLVLRLVEHSAAVTHLPEILYRRRQHAVSETADGEHSVRVVAGHLRRIGAAAAVAPTDDPACRDLRFRTRASDKVGIVIPTKNQVELLRQCLDSLERTVPHDLADICVVDHASDDPATKAYLAGLTGRHCVIPYAASFNFSAINNYAVARLGESCTHYLFLNNDTEAIAPGWLEHMVGYADRSDIGVVGALLLYPNRTAQHAGVIVGLHYGADHGNKLLPAYTPDGQRLAGPRGALLASREQSAVTGACLLIRAEVFRKLGGFDEQLAVGFGDTDICLRAGEMGYKVILDVQAVLLHHESATRGAHPADPHPEDTKRFRARHLHAILQGDRFYSPLLSRQFAYQLGPHAWAWRELPLRTTPVVLPRCEPALDAVRVRAAA